jgi:hypothetical protein
MDNAITRLWDKHMRSDWRELAKRQETRLGEPRDEDADRETVAELQRRLDEARTISDQEPALSGGDPDYFFLSRRVPAKKGKWRMVSVEEAGREN